MSDDVLSVIPTAPHWQPDQAAADRLLSIVEELAPGLEGGVDVDIDVTWHDKVTVVDCGSNLEWITCPLCAASIDTEWWEDLVEAHVEDGFPTLTIDAPCCGRTTSLDALTYEWPCGFARFEVAIWNPERAWFSDQELATLGEALGHPVAQVRAHI
ncbi:hypothetical protein [Streptomyces sp. NPDC020917]|uniref:hypothetical protein n=1 Tax=Streptomyces sp. NPDC020917 TaxID=3365102 RepID=UPI0037A82665